MDIFTSGKVKSGLYAFGSRLSLLFFGFGSFYFLIRTQTKEEFGAWSLFLTVTTILEMSRNGLVQNALIKLFHASHSKDRSKVIFASWIINAFFTVVVYLLILLLALVSEALFDMPALKRMFLWYGITLALLIPITQFNYIQQAHFSFTGIFWASFIRQGVLFLFIFIAYVMTYQISLLELVVWQTIASFFAVLVAYKLSRSFRQGNSKVIWDKAVILKVFDFGKFVMGTNLFSLVFKSADQFVIGALLNPASVALYSSAIRMSNIVEYPATAVAEVVYPYSTSRVSAEGEHVIKSLYEKSVGFTLAVIIPAILFVFLFSDWIIRVVAGSEYSDAGDILRITILFGLLTPFNRQFGMAMDASGRPQINFYLLVFAAILNIILNVFFVRLWGIFGAAYATLLAYLVVSLLGHLYLVKLFKVEIKSIGFYMFSSYTQVWNQIGVQLKR